MLYNSHFIVDYIDAYKTGYNQMLRFRINNIKNDMNYRWCPFCHFGEVGNSAKLDKSINHNKNDACVRWEDGARAALKVLNDTQ